MKYRELVKCLREGCNEKVNYTSRYCNECLTKKFKIISEYEKKELGRTKVNYELYRLGYTKNKKIYK